MSISRERLTWRLVPPLAGLVVAFVLSEILDSDDGSKSAAALIVSCAVGIVVALLAAYLVGRRRPT